MEPAPRLLQKFSQKLFDQPDQQNQFLTALTHPQPFHPCILWLQPKPNPFPFAVEPPVDWQPDFVDRLALGEKPGQHALHQQGAFYCLDFSSVFAASVLLTIQQPVSVVLDMCAAPGGKSIFAWKALQPQQLLCNEVIGKRMGALISNLKRCHIQPSFAFSLDSSLLAVQLSQTADLVLVDAPCSGQSLLAKGEKNPGCFHPVTINKNANRQKRILANSAQTVAPQGFLAYMTCAYSPQENEQVSEWLLQKFPQFQPVEVPYLRAYQSHLTDLPCYRMFPQSGLGAGAFTILLQNTETPTEPRTIQRLTDFLEQHPVIHSIAKLTHI
ncbi:MAG: RsmB/NOP family class I SAM-dependent RNA methyltransferase [Leptolyngbya sp. IPPAS B-1204]|nr:RsmB/NOP family class I SAM-dependent RNA methyltransferase [Elainella sp. C42_A2020_010]RNJ65991.1 MAG: RsmB/NOP family class I SAM-dependent RNA methyltransferase [Leptolyngbya sp. IPPAS B-1204]